MTDRIENVLIEASAGTGKTQALAERLISLVKDAHIPPQEIVALTFSRAAAGEIFERFVTLLAERAESSPRHAEALRSVIASQHLSQIGTLDSFLMRVVRAFPSELGLEGEIEMMDDFLAGEERSRVSFSILRKTDPRVRRNFVDAFALAMNRENVRSFVDSYHKFIANWHRYAMAKPDESAWGVPEAIWGVAPEFAKVTMRDLENAADELSGIVGIPKWEGFVEWVRTFRGNLKGTSGITAKLLELEDLFHRDAIEFKFNNKPHAIKGEDCRKVQHAFTCVFGYVLRMKLEFMRGVRRLMTAFEGEYDRKVRKTGKLVFDDIPRLIASLDDSARLDLEYRMDSRIRAWALDEFQDTSREQWAAISNLIDEARQSDGEKSLFIVGDFKQAIYGWRNGDIGIFKNERDLRDGNGKPFYHIDNLVKSYRFGPAVTEAVNRVFAGDRILDDFPFWRCPIHETAKPELTGFVHRFDAPSTSKESFVEPVLNALKTVDPQSRGLSAAVLVRNNIFGEFLAAGLRRAGMRGVVWEGESSVLDTPALSGYLDLVQLADHPGDMLVYRHFCLTPIAKAMFPEGVPPVGVLSAAMALEFTAKGIVRTFREIRAKFPESPEETWSAFVEERFTEMLRAAADFEHSREAGTRLADFSRYLKTLKERNLAEPGKVRILTIHRSKGLGFDYVVLPLYEYEGLGDVSRQPIVSDRWILPFDLDAKVANSDDELRGAWEDRQRRIEQESLALYYVAMTRAKRAMTLILHPHPKTAKTVRISDIIRDSLPEEIGCRDWYFDLPLKTGDSVATLAVPAAPAVRAARSHVRRKLPSKSFVSGQSAGSLFSPKDFRKAAKERGTAIHREYEKVEFNDWIVRPAGFTELWRERPFEVFADGEWMSGCFDRVVFCGRKAVIQDFKTGRRVDPAAYVGQLRSYRKALHALTGIPESDIACELLLTATKEIYRYDEI